MWKCMNNASLAARRSALLASKKMTREIFFLFLTSDVLRFTFSVNNKSHFRRLSACFHARQTRSSSPDSEEARNEKNKSLLHANETGRAH